MAWDGDAQVHWFGDSSGSWSDAEKHAWLQRRRAVEQDQDQRRKGAIQRATDLLSQAVPREHGYLQRKGLKQCSGLVLDDDSLFVPMRDFVTNALCGGQIIRWLPDERRWEKKMLAGMRAKGAVLRLGPSCAAETILCEGYATGLSIELAIRQMHLSAAVLVCFSDSNLVHVAPLVRGKAFVFADNDASGAGLRAARATGLPYCVSDRQGEDANDLYVRAGLIALCAELMKARVMRRPLGTDP